MRRPSASTHQPAQLKTKAPLDHETRNSYTVTVTATDPSEASGTVTVTINVTDVDEAGTVALSSEYPQVDAALTATPERSRLSLFTGVTWLWESSSDPTDLGNNPWTNISEATSAAYTPVTGDLGNYLRATVSYTDGFASGKTARAESANAVRVNNIPVFPDQDPDTPGDQSTHTTREVEENTAAGVNIGDPVAADDQDTGDTLTYTPGRDGRRLLRHRGNVRAVADQGRAGLRIQEQPHGDGYSNRPVRCLRHHHGNNQCYRRGRGWDGCPVVGIPPG